MVVAGIEVELVQKDIKNLHLAVYPPNGWVRLAAPLDVNEKTLQLYVTSKIPWIRKQQRKFASIDRQSERQYVNRESHYFLGKRYLLRVHETDHPYPNPKVECKTKTYIDLYVKENYSTEQRAGLMKEWYRGELKAILAELVPKWEAVLHVKVNQVNVQTMKTKWGSCNTNNGNVRFNSELAKKPVACIEYVVVHELLHLIERKHNDSFRAYLDKYLPNWQALREQLQLAKI
ncbi:SprT family zinc-dependent metalloprotease [Bacteroidota bacterium]